MQIRELTTSFTQLHEFDIEYKNGTTPVNLLQKPLQFGALIALKVTLLKI